MRLETLQLVAPLTLSSVPEEAESLVGDLHPGDALCQEVGVDGGELAPDVPVLEHGPQGGSEVSAGDVNIVKGIVHYFTMSILKECAVNGHHNGGILSF